MARIPKRAQDLVIQVALDEGREDLPDVNWRRSSIGVRSSGQTSRDYTKVTVTAGENRLDQKLVLLHELAHWLTLERVPGVYKGNTRIAPLHSRPGPITRRLVSSHGATPVTAPGMTISLARAETERRRMTNPKAEHTLSPWKLWDGFDPHRLDGKMCVARIGPDDGSRGIMGTEGHDLVGAEADLILAALAPALLEACKAADEWSLNLHVHDPDDFCDKECPAAMIVAAINQAEKGA